MPWHRRLWLRHDSLPDTYTDPAFLATLRRVHRGSPPRALSARVLATVAADASRLYTTVLRTAMLYVLFAAVRAGAHLELPCLLAVLAHTLLHLTTPTTPTTDNSPSPPPPGISLAFTLLVLSPVLRSLSHTTASDSVFHISFYLTVAHLLTALANHSALSTNLQLANFAVLASRLESSTLAFEFQLLCIETHILLRQRGGGAGARGRWCGVLVDAVAHGSVVWCVGVAASVRVFAGLAAATGVLAGVFLAWHRSGHSPYDHAVFGSWDPREAVLE